MPQRSFHRTRLFLVRHGDTVDEETKRIYKGSIDVPLSAKGIARVTKVAHFLSQYRLDAVYTSTLSRCIDSGDIIARGRKLASRRNSGFNEIGFGQFEGLSFPEIQEKYPLFLSLWLKDPVGQTPPDGEPLLVAQERIRESFARVLVGHRGQDIAIVCHGGVMKIALSTFLGIDLRRMHSLAQDYGCVDIVDFYEDGGVVLQLLNHTVDMD